MSKSAPSETKFATKADLEVVRADVQVVRTDLELVRADVQVVRTDLEVVRADVQVVRTDLELVRTDLGEKIDNVRTEIAGVRTEIADVHSEIADVRTEIRAVGVQVEAMYGILRATGERQSNLEETLLWRMSDEESRIWMRLGVVEETVSQHSTHHAEHRATFSALREELVGLRAAYAREERSPEIVAFEERLARIEVTLGIVQPTRR